MMGMLMMVPTTSLDVDVRPLREEIVASAMRSRQFGLPDGSAMTATPTSVRLPPPIIELPVVKREAPSIAHEFPKIGDLGFCFSDPHQTVRAVNECLVWTSALSHR